MKRDAQWPSVRSRCSSRVGGCTRGGRVVGREPAGRDATTLTVWVGWSARELSEFKKVVAEYDAKNPNVTSKVVGGINDDKIIAALRSGNAPDVVSSFTSSNVGHLLLVGRLDRPRSVPEAGQDRRRACSRPRRSTTRSTRARGARCRCSPTCTASTTTRRSSRRPGLTGPPKTLQQLTTYAKKLTTRKSGRLAQGRRLRPGVRLLPEHDRRATSRSSARSTSTRTASRASRRDPALDEAAHVAEGLDRLLRLRQAREVADRRR